MQENIVNESNIIIEKRKNLTISGVKDCISFDEETIILSTVLGRLTIKGIALHITNFDVTNGDFSAEGKINAVVYTLEEQKGGFFSRIFK